MSRAAFTLLELLMVVIIIGILAAMALPQFGRTTERSYQRQAWDMLQTIYAGERTYFSTNNKFYDPTAVGNNWNTIYMDNPTTTTTTYAFSSADLFATTFTATATRTGGTICNNDTMTINQSRTRGFTTGTTDWGGVGGVGGCPMPL